MIDATETDVFSLNKFHIKNGNRMQHCYIILNFVVKFVWDKYISMTNQRFSISWSKKEIYRPSGEAMWRIRIFPWNWGQFFLLDWRKFSLQHRWFTGVYFCTQIRGILSASKRICEHNSILFILSISCVVVLGSVLSYILLDTSDWRWFEPLFCSLL